MVSDWALCWGWGLGWGEQLMASNFSSLQSLSKANLEARTPSNQFYRKGSGDPENMSQLPKLPQVRYRDTNPAPFQSLLHSNGKSWCPSVGCGGDRRSQYPAPTTCCVTPGRSYALCCLHTCKYREIQTGRVTSSSLAGPS